MKVHVNIRGSDERGDFTIQTRVDARHLLDALEAILLKWHIAEASLQRVHIEPVKPEPER